MVLGEGCNPEDLPFASGAAKPATTYLSLGCLIGESFFYEGDTVVPPKVQP